MNNSQILDMIESAFNEGVLTAQFNGHNDRRDCLDFSDWGDSKLPTHRIILSQSLFERLENDRTVLRVFDSLAIPNTMGQDDHYVWAEFRYEITEEYVLEVLSRWGIHQ